MDRNTTTVIVTVLVLVGVAFCLKPPGGQTQDAPSVLEVVEGNVDLAELKPTPEPTGNSNSIIQRVQHATRSTDSQASRINPFRSAPNLLEAAATNQFNDAATNQPSPVAIPGAITQPATNRENSGSRAFGSKSDRQITRLPPAPTDLPAIAVNIDLPKSDQVRDLEELLPNLKSQTKDAFATLDLIDSSLRFGESQTEFDADKVAGSEIQSLDESAGLLSLDVGRDESGTDNAEIATEISGIAANAPVTLHDELPPLLEPNFQALDTGSSTASRPTANPKKSRRREVTRDLRQPTEADPGWVVDNNRDSVSRESILDVDIPRHVEARAMSMLRDATKLADRGALCAARQQFMRILRITCQTLDTQLGQPIHARGLANGLRALEEAEDFALTDNTPEADIHLIGYIQGHRTPVLKNADPNQITALMAMKRYYKYAYEQLALAGNNEQVASEGLFALGRIESMLKEKKVAVKGGGPKALALYHAALTVNSRNGRAANELGVILAKRGRSQDALYVLKQAAAARPTADVLHNLAVVHNQLSDPISARHAQQQANQLAGGQKTTGSEGNIQWVTPQQFAALSDGDSVESVAAKSPKSGRSTAPPQERTPVRTATRPTTNSTWDF